MQNHFWYEVGFYFEAKVVKTVNAMTTTTTTTTATTKTNDSATETETGATNKLCLARIIRSADEALISQNECIRIGLFALSTSQLLNPMIFFLLRTHFSSYRFICNVHI